MKKGLIFLLSAFFVFGRLFSYFRSPVPLGYDAGLYLFAFREYAKIPLFSYPSLPSVPVFSDYPPLIPVLGRLLSSFVAPEKLLVPLILFFSVALFFAVYLVAKRLWGEDAALWTTFIFTVSALQYRVYWYYYLKNIAGLTFLLVAYLLLLSRSYWAILFSALVIYTHRPTALLLLLALLISALVSKPKRRYYLKVFGASLAVAALYYLPNFDRTILPLLRPISVSLIPQDFGGSLGSPSGTFYRIAEATVLSLPYLPFAIYGVRKFARTKKASLIGVPLAVSFLVVVFRLFFYRRIIIFLDFFLLFFAGVGVQEFIKKINNPRIKGVFTKTYISILIIFIAIYIYSTGKPLIYADELREIKLLTQTEPESFVLVTDQAYTPFVYGWSDRKTIAPGYGENDIYWTIPEWHRFWMSGDREAERELLLKLPKPLYIYSGDMQPKYKFDFQGPCFKRVNWRTYKFICEE